MGCQIHHDVEIGDYTIIGPKSVILGDTKIEENCFIGASSSIRNKVTVSSNTFLKMGSILINSTKKDPVYFGYPAKYQKKMKKFNFGTYNLENNPSFKNLKNYFL